MSLAREKAFRPTMLTGRKYRMWGREVQSSLPPHRRNNDAGRKLLQCLNVMKPCAVDQNLFLDSMSTRIAFE
jgi:hypothetical protein